MGVLSTVAPIFYYYYLLIVVNPYHADAFVYPYNSSFSPKLEPSIKFRSPKDFRYRSQCVRDPKQLKRDGSSSYRREWFLAHDDEESFGEERKSRKQEENRVPATSLNLIKVLLGSGVLALPAGIAAFSDHRTAYVQIRPSTIRCIGRSFLNHPHYCNIQANTSTVIDNGFGRDVCLYFQSLRPVGAFFTSQESGRDMGKGERKGVVMDNIRFNFYILFRHRSSLFYFVGRRIRIPRRRRGANGDCCDSPQLDYTVVCNGSFSSL
jgi:hypothetical protein